MSVRTADLPWLAVLALICIFHLIRGARPDFVLFAVAFGFALIGSPRPLHAEAKRQHTAMIVTIALVLGVLLEFAPRHGTLAGVLVCAIGVAAAVGARMRHNHLYPNQMPTSHEHAPSALRNAMIAWSCVIVLAGLWEATAYLTWRWGALPAGVMPSVSDLADPLLDTSIGKAVFIAAWLAGGIALIGHAYPGRRDTCTR